MSSFLLSKKYLWVYLLGMGLFLAGAKQDWLIYGLVGVVVFLWVVIWRRRNIIPNQLFGYLIVLLLMGIALLWCENKELVYKNLIMFLIGGGWMYLGYVINEKEKGVERKLAWMITVLGLGWMMIFLWNEFFVEGVRIGSRGLVWWGTHTKDHHHLGDWWALLVLSQLWILKSVKSVKKKYLNLLLILSGIVWIYFSRSRSAIVSVIGGSMFLFGSKLGKEKIYKWMVCLLVLVFIFLGLSKPTFLNRQYWLQGVVGWWRNPFGVGMGNFGRVSADVRNHVFGLNEYSSVAHNVFLEFLVGMGVFGLVFWWWVVKNVVEPFMMGKVKSSLISGLVLALGINFMFDMTYLVASMWWLFMFLLGLMVEGESS